MTPKELTWDQTLRFRLLEIVLQWEGRLTTNHLMTAFNIGRQQASRDIKRPRHDSRSAKPPFTPPYKGWVQSIREVSRRFVHASLQVIS